MNKLDKVEIIFIAVFFAALTWSCYAEKKNMENNRIVITVGEENG